eukprot:jgi/Bigna1/86525/estExt_fgenesh1_pg.C_110106
MTDCISEDRVIILDMDTTARISGMIQPPLNLDETSSQYRRWCNSILDAIKKRCWCSFLIDGWREWVVMFMTIGLAVSILKIGITWSIGQYQYSQQHPLSSTSYRTLNEIPAFTVGLCLSKYGRDEGGEKQMCRSPDMPFLNNNRNGRVVYHGAVQRVKTIKKSAGRGFRNFSGYEPLSNSSDSELELLVATNKHSDITFSQCWTLNPFENENLQRINKRRQDQLHTLQIVIGWKNASSAGLKRSNLCTRLYLMGTSKTRRPFVEGQLAYPLHQVTIDSWNIVHSIHASVRQRQTTSIFTSTTETNYVELKVSGSRPVIEGKRAIVAWKLPSTNTTSEWGIDENERVLSVLEFQYPYNSKWEAVIETEVFTFTALELYVCIIVTIGVACTSFSFFWQWDPYTGAVYFRCGRLHHAIKVRIQAFLKLSSKSPASPTANQQSPRGRQTYYYSQEQRFPRHATTSTLGSPRSIRQSQSHNHIQGEVYRGRRRSLQRRGGRRKSAISLKRQTASPTFALDSNFAEDRLPQLNNFQLYTSSRKSAREDKLSRCESLERKNSDARPLAIDLTRDPPNRKKHKRSFAKIIVTENEDDN